MLSDHQRITWRRIIAENFNRLSRVHERYRQTTDRQTDDRQTTDGRTTIYSEHKHEFTFAKNHMSKGKVSIKPAMHAYRILYIMTLR